MVALNNRIVAEAAARTAPCAPSALGQREVAERFPDLLRDESKLAAEVASRVYLPTSTEELSALLRACAERDERLLISGGRTGVVGGAVARGVDAIVSLTRMDRVLKTFKTKLRVQAGMTLERFTLAAAEAAPDRFYPVDPTETSASVGGNISTNASGARSFHYGATRRWVEALTVVLANGSVLRLRRGRCRADGHRFCLVDAEGRARAFSFPDHAYPAAKNTAGYQLARDMDAIDLFVGAEGTLGVITEAELRLALKPAARLYLTIWADTEAQVLELVGRLRVERGLNLLAIEYFDPASIDLLRERRRGAGGRALVPAIDADARAALFLDLAYRDEAELERCTEALDRKLAEVGLSLERTWSGLAERELARMKQLRHALPETVNGIISARKRSNPELHKLSTDLAVPDGRLGTMLDTYRRLLGEAGIEHVIFGHIGDNHLHCNMLPRDVDELGRAKELYDQLAVEAVALGGTIAAEHGVGRLKRHLMPAQYPPTVLSGMQSLRDVFDPERRLNPGVLLPDR